MLLSANDHLFSCERCFERFQAGQPADEWVSINLGESVDGHDLLYDQLEKYVDQEMSPGDRAGFELHLDRCVVCREEVADLLELKSAMAGSKPVGPLTEKGARTEDPTGSPGIRVKWYAGPIGLWVGAAAALVLAVVLSVVVSLPLRKEVAGLRAQIQSLERENEAVKREAGTQLQDLTSRLQSLENLPGGPSGRGPDSVGTIIALRDRGRVIELEGGVLRGLESASADSRREVEAALGTSRVRVPPAGMLSGKTSVLMGTSPDGVSFSVTSPVGVVVEEDQPLFKWNQVAGASSYMVVISNMNSHKLINSEAVTGNQWRPPAPLARGATYSWEVRATLSGGQEVSAPAPPAPMARFKVVSESEERRIEEARRLNPQSHLLLGVLCARAGLTEAARRELRALSDENPGSPVAGKLLASLGARPSGHKNESN